VLEDYIPFTVVLLVMSASSMAIECYQVRKQQRHLRAMVRHQGGQLVTVLRHDKGGGATQKRLLLEAVVPSQEVAKEKNIKEKKIIKSALYVFFS
jgi:hypothetical protein